MNYWEECISEAFEEIEIKATKEQIAGVVEWVEGAHENYSMAHGHDCIPNPLLSEVDKLKRQIKEIKENQDRQLFGIKCKNTDKELWREKPGDYYSDSILVTEYGGIGINCGGHIIVAPVKKWHAAAEVFLCVNPNLKQWKWELAMWLLGERR